MRSVTVRLEDLKTMRLNLGYVGENLHRQFRFDSRIMFNQYPHASVALTVVPPEGESYPAIIERDGDLVIWDVTDSDLTAEGSGEIQLTFHESPHIAKTYIGTFCVSRSLMPTGEIPTGLDDFIARAGEALTAIPETIDAALEAAKESGEFDGSPGADGYSPTVTVTDIQGGHRVTITDAEGSHVFDVLDGQGGGGGTSDYSDLANKPQIGGVTLAGNKTLHEIGAAAEGDIPTKVSDLTNDSGYLTAETDPTVPAWAKEQTKPTYTAQEVGAVSDVQVNGTSIVNNGVANIPMPKTETVSGTTPSITGTADTRYICGEVSTISITAPESGCIDVTFKSGSTPAVLTVSSAKTGVTAIKWANGFDPTSLDADTTYEINILDGEYGVVGSWT